MSNIAQLISAIETVVDQQNKTAAILVELQKQIAVEIKKEEAKEQQEEIAKKYIDFFSDELDKYIPGGKLFVARLNFVRQNGQKYHDIAPLHKELVNKPAAGWAKRRQLLLTASAIWRYTFDGRCRKLRAGIEGAVECTDCGEFVQGMIQRMIKEGLWK
jgi:hypothetical protein